MLLLKTRPTRQGMEGGGRRAEEEWPGLARDPHSVMGTGELICNEMLGPIYV